MLFPNTIMKAIGFPRKFKKDDPIQTLAISGGYFGI